MPTVQVTGMSCEHCAGAVTKALTALEGVSNVKVDLRVGEVAYEADDTVDMNAIQTAVESVGYRLR